MKKKLAGLFLVAMATLVVSPVAVRAETVSTTAESTTSSLLTLLQSLMKQVEDLQKQLSALRGEVQEVRAELKDGLKEGMSDDDIKKVQELLASDPSIYPKGIVSGYYGPLTKEAIKNLQRRHGLTETGEIDAETKALILEYFKEKTNGKLPPGLLRAPGIDKKIMERFRKDDNGKYYLDCDDSSGSAFLCKNKKDDDDDDDEDEDEEDDDNDKTKDTAVAMTRAEDMVEAAGNVIDDLKDAIEEAKADDVSADDIEDAEKDLERAEEELAAAEDYFEAEEYQKARDEAYKAKKSAYAGIDELN